MKNLEMIKHHENIKYVRSDFKWTNLRFSSVFGKGLEVEYDRGAWSKIDP